MLPFGLLWLDPGLSAFAFAAAVPGENRLVQSVQIPNLLPLRNTEWFLQALVGPESGTPYLTHPATLRIL